MRALSIAILLVLTIPTALAAVAATPPFVDEFDSDSIASGEWDGSGIIQGGKLRLEIPTSEFASIRRNVTGHGNNDLVMEAVMTPETVFRYAITLGNNTTGLKVQLEADDVMFCLCFDRAGSWNIQAVPGAGTAVAGETRMLQLIVRDDGTATARVLSADGLTLLGTHTVTGVVRSSDIDLMQIAVWRDMAHQPRSAYTTEYVSLNLHGAMAPPVPELGTIALVGMGAVAVAAVALRRRG